MEFRVSELDQRSRPMSVMICFLYGIIATFTLRKKEGWIGFLDSKYSDFELEMRHIDLCVWKGKVIASKKVIFTKDTMQLAHERQSHVHNEDQAKKI
eukprot:scaffold578_cov157-Chaetoceros_neogracile.AAC.3